MCNYSQMIRNEALAEGEAKGRADTVLQFMRNTGKTFDEIATLLGYSWEQANEIRPIVEQLAEAQ